MISSAEARLGRSMSMLVAITALLQFVVAVVLIGPDATGYSEQWGLLNGVVNVAQNFGAVVMLMFAIKLFNLDGKPLLKVLSYLAIIGTAISVFMDLSPAAHAAGGWTGNSFSPTEIQDMAGGITYGTWIIFPLWVLLVSMGERRGDILPSWASMAGIGAAILILAVNFGFLLSILPESIILPVWIIGGVILYPTFVFGVSRAFAGKM